MIQNKEALVVIGSSTGGVEALYCILDRYPGDCPATVIVQHMKAEYVPGMVSRLNSICAAEVMMAEDGCIVRSGQVVLAPGNSNHLLISNGSKRCVLKSGEKVHGHRPSIDRLFSSAASYGENCVGVILTGMGRDGADGLREIRSAGGWTIAQDAATCVVYGMPRVAKENGAVIEELPLSEICDAILNAAIRREART